MIWKLQLGRWRFTFSMAPTTTVAGVHSTLPNDKHILMWDFDDISFEEVVNILVVVQRVYDLPNIYILETKANTNYIAYCFTAVTFIKACEIIAFTPKVDWIFFKYAVLRECFTLRVTPKHGRKPKILFVLKSDVKEDAWIPELKSWVKYQTLADDADTRVKELKI